MNIAFIPVRGGSKSIPLKNIKNLCGRPLVYWVIKAANECKYIDNIYVSTDSDVIKDTVLSFEFDNVFVVDRSKESASDIASTELAMLEFAENTDFDSIALIQATSPLLKGEDLDKGFELLENDKVDSVLSVVEQKRFLWKKNNDIFTSPINYDFKNRPRRQEFNGNFVENGAFYITNREKLLLNKNRLSGNIAYVEMSQYSFFEIDEPEDWNIVEYFKNLDLKKEPNNSHIKMFITDNDGCLTDGGMYYSDNGIELKKFNTKDGLGISLLKEKGIVVGVITGEKTRINRNRAKKLSLDFLIENSSNKLNALHELINKYSIKPNEVAYMGDDINDLECMQYIKKNGGIAGCPADASKNIVNISDFISTKKGGDGAVREFIEWILENK